MTKPLWRVSKITEIHASGWGTSRQEWGAKYLPVRGYAHPRSAIDAAIRAIKIHLKVASWDIPGNQCLFVVELVSNIYGVNHDKILVTARRNEIDSDYWGTEKTSNHDN